MILYTLLSILLVLSSLANLWLYLDLRNARRQAADAQAAARMWRQCAGDAVDAINDLNEQRAAYERDHALLTERYVTVRHLYIQRTQQCLSASLGHIRLQTN